MLFICEFLASNGKTKDICPVGASSLFDSYQVEIYPSYWSAGKNFLVVVVVVFSATTGTLSWKRMVFWCLYAIMQNQ